jgi:hypothetical protein
MSGIFYFWRSHTATVSGSTTRRERCVGCSCLFEYEITCQATGGGHSAFFLNDARAAASAKTRARANLNRALNEAIEPAHCPACGIFQPDMVRVLRERHGKRCEPNKYASERIAAPVADAWRAACVANTVESYTKFMEVWPTFSWHAERQIKELKYPPLLRKLVSGLFWIVWGALVLFVIGIIAIFIGERH